MRALVPLWLIAGWLSIGTAAGTPSGSPAGVAATGTAPAAVTAPAAAAVQDGADVAAPRAPVAGAVATDAAAAELAAELSAILSRPGWRDDRWSVLVYSLDRGDTLFAHGAYDVLAPASNMKLFTTAAALYFLGPDYRWNTFLLATGPIRDGVLDGDLVVYGTGDPTFSGRFGGALAIWQAFADTLAAHGVREIRGDIVGDGSYFDGPGAGEGWQHSYMNASYAATAGALSYAENVAMLRIQPAQQAGWRPTVRLLPGGEGIAVVNQATTVARGATRIQAARVAYDGPVVISGQIAVGSAPVDRAVPVSDPERFAAAVFREVLLRRDIVITGSLRSARTADESPVTGRSVFAPALDPHDPIRVLAVHTSPPILQVLDIINQRSHNLMAEQVLRTVGRVAAGTGSVEGGRRAIEYMMRAEGHPAPEEVAVYDGSGLSVLNRSSARALVSLLAVMAESPLWDVYWQTLPEAGSARLRRMGATPAQANLRAKTGTIDRVSALSGYVRAANGERLAFAIVSNNVPSTAMAKRMEDAIGARLAGFTRPVAGVAAGTAGTADGAGAPATGAPPAPGTTQAAPSAVPAPAPAPAPTRPTPPAQPERAARTHTIRSGDTLDALARRYGTTVAELQRLNPGLDARRLIPGRTVRVP
jgi:serine-type D-Ala-D-Ala carboxypeptidase/endopeptidase (penicillin-binding protein 4)